MEGASSNLMLRNHSKAFPRSVLRRHCGPATRWIGCCPWAKLYRTLPPGGIWFLASAAFFALGTLFVSGSGDGSMRSFGVIGALVSLLVLVAFGGSQHRR
jgi:hypothetical protein